MATDFPEALVKTVKLCEQPTAQQLLKQVPERVSGIQVVLLPTARSILRFLGSLYFDAHPKQPSVLILRFLGGSPFPCDSLYSTERGTLPSQSWSLLRTERANPEQLR